MAWVTALCEFEWVRTHMCQCLALTNSFIYRNESMSSRRQREVVCVSMWISQREVTCVNVLHQSQPSSTHSCVCASSTHSNEWVEHGRDWCKTHSNQRNGNLNERREVIRASIWKSLTYVLLNTSSTMVTRASKSLSRTWESQIAIPLIAMCLAPVSHSFKFA